MIVLVKEFVGMILGSGDIETPGKVFPGPLGETQVKPIKDFCGKKSPKPWNKRLSTTEPDVEEGFLSSWCSFDGCSQDRLPLQVQGPDHEELYRGGGFFGYKFTIMYLIHWLWLFP